MLRNRVFLTFSPMLSMASPNTNGIKLDGSNDDPTKSDAASEAAIKIEPTAIGPDGINNDQQDSAEQIAPKLNGTDSTNLAPNNDPAPLAANNAPNMFPQAKAKSVPNAPLPSSQSGSRGNSGGGQLLQFPWKLHEMLHLAEKNGKTNIISWLPGGNGFKVHNKEKFCAEIMPGYFASQKYKTFQRSLNLWGFESVAKGPDRGACYHQYFVKGHPELCHSM